MNVDFSKILYIFIDEGGNLDFTSKGSKYFSLTSISMRYPFNSYRTLDDYKYYLLLPSANIELEHFHCSDDNKHIRKNIFNIIQHHINDIRIDNVVLEKSKATPELQKTENLYPFLIKHLLQYAIAGHLKQYGTLSGIVVVTDKITKSKQRHATKQAIRKSIKKLVKTIPYRITHHASKAHYGLQMVDYCNWAIYRKWERGDVEYYNIIKPALKSEFDVSNKEYK